MLQDVAQIYGSPHLTASTVKSQSTYEYVRDARPDYIVAVGISELLPSRVLNIPQELGHHDARHAADHAVTR